MYLRALLFSLMVLLMAPRTGGAATLDVCPSGCPYSSPGAAAFSAASGDTIRVAGGTYESGIGVPSDGTFTFQGGYSADFSTRDPSLYPSVISAIGFNELYRTFTAVIDGFEVRNSSYSGVYLYSPNSSVTLSNCRIINSGYLAIQASRFKSFSVTNSYIEGSVYETLVGIASDGSHDVLNFTGNTAVGRACESCMAVYLTGVKSSDTIADNAISGAKTGLNLQPLNNAQSPLVSGNRIFRNTGTGLYVQQGSPRIWRNRIYANGGTGISAYMWSSDAHPSVLHNLSADNGDSGIEFVGSAGLPEIRNNILYHNGWSGIEIKGSGWGNTNISPTALSYNCFSGNAMPGFRHFGQSPYSFNHEQPDEYGVLNQFAWTQGNIRLDDPGLVDPANDDYRLRSDSFLVDEGDPDDPIATEPAPHGNRVNLGPEGGANDATTSPSSPALLSVTAQQDGNDLLISLETTTDTAYLWLDAEYFDGSSYSPVAPSKISGDGYAVGYKAGRAASGTRTLRYSGAAADHLGTQSAQAKIRLTVSHGNDSFSLASAGFAADFTAPLVHIVSPAADTVYPSPPVSMITNASDGDGTVTGVTFQYKASSASDWVTLNTDTSSPYEPDWSGTSLALGATYDLRVIAEDSSGKTAADTVSGVHLCGVSVSPLSVTAPRAGGASQLTVTASNPSCNWMATSNDLWFWSNMNWGSGSGTMQLTITANQTGAARTGTMTILGNTVQVIQAGPAPTPEQTPTPTPSSGTPAPTPTSSGGDPSPGAPDATVTPTAAPTLTPAPTVTPPADVGKADLKATLVRKVKKGSKLLITARCSNQGFSTAGTVEVGFYLSKKRDQPQKRVARKTLASLPPGAQGNVSLSPPLRPGYRFAFIICDSGGQIEESNEENNRLMFKLPG